jgi:hypothetical protein
MFNAFLVDTTSAHAIDHPLTLEAMQSTVGGYIEPVFTIDSPTRPGYAITGYVNDSGVIDRLPFTCFLDGSPDPLAGPLLVCGLRYEDGETAPLTVEELDWLDERTRLVMMAGRITPDGERDAHALHSLDLSEHLD